MSKVQNIVAVLGEYTNKQGETKKQYQTIGKLITKDDGKQSIKLDLMPTNWEGRANVYDIEKKEDSPF